MHALVQTLTTAAERAVAPVPRDAGQDQRLVDSLRRSRIFRDYQRAFETSIGLPLELHGPVSFGLVHARSRKVNPFCALMAANNRTCSGCLELQERVRERATDRAETLTCFAGLSESAVPVRLGERVVAFLHVGQVMLHQPSKTGFARTAHLLRRWDAHVDLKRMRAAYFRSRVVDRRHYEALLRLLAIFAQQLSALSNQLIMASEQAEPLMIEHAKRYIAEHADEEITLARVAGAVHTSTFYFCKLFRRVTGLHFLEYVARTRVEKVKATLLNSRVRISEAAYGAGFQSLSQFNRVFKRVVGQQPRAWREHLTS